MKKLSVFVVFITLLAASAVYAQGAVTTKGHNTLGEKRVLLLDNAGRAVGGTRIIDACESTTGWTALSNDTTGIATDLDHVIGLNSLEFDKVDGADNLTVGGIQRAITPINLSFLVENGGAFTYSLNVSSLTLIDYCFVRLGTDASNYNEWRIPDTALATGWNAMRFSIDSPSTAGATGSGWNSASVVYLAVGCNFDVETNVLLDIRVDHIAVHVGLETSANISATASAPGAPAPIDLVEVAGALVTVGAGSVTANTPRISVSDDDILSISKDNNPNLVTNPVFTQISQDGTSPVDATHPIPISKDLSANAVTNPVFTQISQDGTSPVDATHPIPISKDLAANAVGNPLQVELSNGAAPFFDNTAAPGYTRDQDGDSTVVGDILDAYVDGLALTLNGKVTLAVLAGSNGATLDIGKMSSTDGFIVNQENRSCAYDESSCEAGIRIKSMATVTVPAQETTTTAATPTDILDSRVVLGYAKVTLYIYNDDGADSLASTSVQVSGTGAAGDWVTLSTSDCGAMAPAATCRYSFDSAEKYVKVVATDAGTATDMRVIAVMQLN